MLVYGIIPARYASTRFPGKPLASINGRPMIEVVYERVRMAGSLDRILVATDDKRIEEAVRRFGGEVMVTSSAHNSGTDRVAEACDRTQADIVVNIQGDEPLILPEQIDALVRAMTDEPRPDMSTLITPMTDLAEFGDPNVVKVVTDLKGNALYFSRASIPFVAEPGKEKSAAGPFKHIGIYAYTRDFLSWMSQTEPTALERVEKLEQLRALEHGRTIRAVLTEHETFSIDRPEDIRKVERRLKQ